MLYILIPALCLILQACSNADHERKTRLDALNQQIEQVQAEITQEEKKELNANVESEGYMRADYGHFAQVLEKADVSENRVKDLQELLSRLKEEKKALENK